MKYKETIKNNKILYTGVKTVRRIQYGVLNPLLFSVGVTLRKIGIIKTPLKELNNKYNGERCFIIATGPSLTLDDINLLRNEYTFGMNSLCKVFETTGWETTFFGVQDYNVYGSLQDDIRKMSNSILLFGSNLKERYTIDRGYVFPLDFMNHVTHTIDEYKTAFSEDCSVRVYDGYTITYSLIQLAVYFGFKEIYLLGCDCGYSGEKHHFIEHGVIDPNFSSAQERMFFSYQVAKDYADEHGIRIFNATRGGALEIFTRVKLEDVLYTPKMGLCE